MGYEHPLAYLLGIEGIALLRAFTGEHDRDFVESRIAEVRRLLDDGELASAGVAVDRVDTVDGYRVWARKYDEPGNAAFDIDEPVLAEIVGTLPAGFALDAACGTGRLSGFLAAQGHRVVGVDTSPEMLARARERVPEGEFLLGDLRRLPVGDAEVDVVLCGLALTHVRALDPVFAEFARVLRPGGHLVLSDVHPEAVARGSIPAVRSENGRPGRVVTHRHSLGDYLRAALRTGFQPRRCEEPDPPVREHAGAPDPVLGPWDLWPWCLTDLVPEAARAANAGMPAMVIWQFQLAGEPGRD